MENLKNVISLNQASKISGYHSDYLSALIRKKEIKGKKIGGNWFTTEEEINDYIFKQKIRHKELAISDFLSPKRAQHIFVITGIIFLSFLLLGTYFYKNNKATFQEGNKILSPDVEVIQESEK